MSNQRFHGKHRGTVTQNQDPNNLGRIKASVPSVFGDNESGWALPSVPYAGPNVGFFFIPPVGANVWIEFEGGNPLYPIWTGCFWNDGDLPASAKSPNSKVINTGYGTIVIDDAGQSFSYETTDGLKILMDSTGITLSNGSSTIKLSQASVSINDDALEIM